VFQESTRSSAVPATGPACLSANHAESSSCPQHLHCMRAAWQNLYVYTSLAFNDLSPRKHALPLVSTERTTSLAEVLMSLLPTDHAILGACLPTQQTSMQTPTRKSAKSKILVHMRPLIKRQCKLQPESRPKTCWTETLRLRRRTRMLHPSKNAQEKLMRSPCYLDVQRRQGLQSSPQSETLRRRRPPCMMPAEQCLCLAQLARIHLSVCGPAGGQAGS
jgi:hypothetical protein